MGVGGPDCSESHYPYACGDCRSGGRVLAPAANQPNGGKEPHIMIYFGDSERLARERSAALLREAEQARLVRLARQHRAQYGDETSRQTALSRLSVQSLLSSLLSLLSLVSLPFRRFRARRTHLHVLTVVPARGEEVVLQSYPASPDAA